MLTRAGPPGHWVVLPGVTAFKPHVPRSAPTPGWSFRPFHGVFEEQDLLKVTEPSVLGFLPGDCAPGVTE